jgi:photosystem II stability/assembly factor-like uncharacterized protein
LKRYTILLLAKILLYQTFGLGQSSPQFKWEQFEMTNKVSLRGIFAVSPQTVWASGNNGSYFYTNDGGKTWTAGRVDQADSLDFRDIQILENGRVILLACGPGKKSQIFISDDQGTTWLNVFKNPFDNGFFSAMAFWDNQRGIAFSDPVNNQFKLITTEDGGTTWTLLAPETMPNAETGEYAFAASGTCITVAGFKSVWFATGGSVARIFYSTNSGKTWTVTPTSILHGQPSQGIFSIAFRDSLQGFACGGDYQIPQKNGQTLLKTLDGGNNSTAVNDSSMGYRSCIAPYQTEYAKGWLAVGKNGWSISEDDGATWHHYSSPGYYAISISNNIVWAAGANGRIGKYSITP